MNSSIRIITILCMLLFVATRIYAAGLSALAGLGKSQKEMQETVDNETKAFAAIKKALETGDLKKGESGQLIREQYGEPVVILPGTEADSEKWIYKPGYAPHFGGIKIYLFLNARGRLSGIKMLNSGK
ncbi:MAG: hypothetical protein NG740_06030 [Omnitrophica bacterium]|nr:hypothetical protein [Candidatus Omnitrophota bacterium]